MFIFFAVVGSVVGNVKKVENIRSLILSLCYL